MRTFSVSGGGGVRNVQSPVESPVNHKINMCVC